MLLVGLIIQSVISYGQKAPTTQQAEAPKIGAQVWVEPGMSEQLIARQFQILKEMNMPVARLFLVWNWMEPEQGKWSFTLYDQCFEHAAKNGVKIVATLMPNQPPAYVGPAGYYKVQDGAAAKTQADKDAQAVYINQVVTHYAKHPALGAWMLMNEPGQLPSPDPLAIARFRGWLKNRYNDKIGDLNKSWLTAYKTFDEVEYAASWAGGGWTWPGAFVDWNTFWREHLTWYLSFIAEEIRKVDKVTELHVNPHALIDIQEKYDLPQWMNFLGSIGASIHPVWHFDALKRQQYTTGVSLVSDFIRTAAGDKPFWITELQGGLNLYTGSAAVTPKASEIKSWLWTGIGAGAKNVIFWCLNPRLKGTEAGEWAMVDYQYKPTDRLIAAADVAKKVNENAKLFQDAVPQPTDIYLIQSPETMILQQRAKLSQGNNIGRTQRAHKDAVIGTYMALQTLGISPRVQDINYMGWQNKDKRSKLAILPHVSALSEPQIKNLISFVEQGHTLVLTGLTGMFDHYEETNYNQQSALLTKLLGGAPQAVVPYPLPANKERESLKLQIERAPDDELTRLLGDVVYSQQLGAGKIIVCGGLAGLDFYHEPDKSRLNQLLAKLIQDAKAAPTVRFNELVQDVTMRVMNSGTTVLTTLANTGGISKPVQLTGLGGRKGTIITGEASVGATGKNQLVVIPPNETVVIVWN